MIESRCRWLNRVRSDCQAPELVENRKLTLESCLRNYVARLDELRQSATPSAAYVWTRFFSYASAMAPDESDDNKPRLAETGVDYPQIDHPLDSNAQSINSMIASKAG